MNVPLHDHLNYLQAGERKRIEVHFLLNLYIFCKQICGMCTPFVSIYQLLVAQGYFQCVRAMFVMLQDQCGIAHDLLTPTCLPQNLLKP